MRDQQGSCPICESAGSIGHACPEKLCSSHGYHFIPNEYFQKLVQVPFRSRDPHLGIVIADYLLVDELGIGGFGKVYLALQIPILMKAAMKLMRLDNVDRAMERGLHKKFESEALSLAKLAHPNIVRLLKYGAFQDVPYMVMEYVEHARTMKAELAARFLQKQGVDLETTRHIVAQLLNALDSAHDLQIVHRDIKPENIMLQRVKGDEFFVRVLDFGLAKFVADRSETSMAIGTPIYMAPEQLHRKHIGPWTDLYAVGVITFEMLTGRRPFSGDNTQEVLHQKLDPAYDPVSTIADLNFPEPMLDFFRKALSREINQRYKSATEFREALTRVDPGESEQYSPEDLTGLFDASELLGLARERATLEEERREFEQERKHLKLEKRRIEEQAERKMREALIRLEAEKQQAIEDARRSFVAQSREFRRPVLDPREMGDAATMAGQPSNELRSIVDANPEQPVLESTQPITDGDVDAVTARAALDADAVTGPIGGEEPSSTRMMQTPDEADFTTALDPEDAAQPQAAAGGANAKKSSPFHSISELEQLLQHSVNITARMDHRETDRALREAGLTPYSDQQKLAKKESTPQEQPLPQKQPEPAPAKAAGVLVQSRAFRPPSGELQTPVAAASEQKTVVEADAEALLAQIRKSPARPSASAATLTPGLSSLPQQVAAPPPEQRRSPMGLYVAITVVGVVVVVLFVWILLKNKQAKKSSRDRNVQSEKQKPPAKLPPKGGVRSERKSVQPGAVLKPKPKPGANPVVKHKPLPTAPKPEVEKQPQ